MIFLLNISIFRHKDSTETSEKHWGKNYIDANVYIYISFFPQTEKSGIEYHFILYLIWLVHFSTNTHTYAHT